MQERIGATPRPTPGRLPAITLWLTIDTSGPLPTAQSTGIISLMTTLAEIERAAEQLPGAEQTKLFYFLVQRIFATGLPLPEPREFSAEQLQHWLEIDEADMNRFRTGA